MADGNVALAGWCVTVAGSCAARMGGGAGAVAGCGLARTARLLTAAWATTEVITVELEAPVTQEKMLL